MSARQRLRRRIDPWLDPRTVPERSAVLSPLVEWIEEHWLSGDPVVGDEPRILDLGCGDMLLRRLLDGCRIDGLDTSPSARDAARRTLAEIDVEGEIFDNVDDVPGGVYDAVIMSSMLQYLPDEADVTRMLALVAESLRPAGSLGAVVTDVVTPGGSRVDDARDLARFLYRRFGGAHVVSGLARSATRSPGRLSAFSDEQLARSATSSGLVVRSLADNLSPFRSRSTYVLEKLPAGEHGGEGQP